jgi:hypothetical protein
MSTSALPLMVALSMAQSLSPSDAVAVEAPDPEPAAAPPEEPVRSAGTFSGTTTAQPIGPALTPERVARLRNYQNQRFTVRDETELRGGAAMVQPMAGPTLSTNVVVVDSFYTVQTWGVYQGAERMAPSTFLRETGETFRADDLERRVERDHRRSRRWMMLAGMGAASLTAGVIQYDRAQDYPHKLLAHQLTFGGLAVGMTGLIGASFPASRASRLESYPGAVVNRPEAEEMAERHNKALQQELGLTTEDLLLLELAEGL